MVSRKLLGSSKYCKIAFLIYWLEGSCKLVATSFYALKYVSYRFSLLVARMLTVWCLGCY